MAIEQAAIGSTVPLTFRDLEGMPDDGRFYELSNGVLIVSPPPTTGHQRVATRIARYLDDHLTPGQVILVEAGLQISDDTVKVPDVMVVDEALIGGQHITGTPAVVVEVASPSTSLLDRTEKREVYAGAGIAAYWLVDPIARTITVLELDDGAYVEIATLAGDERCDVSVPTVFTLDVASILG